MSKPSSQESAPKATDGSPLWKRAWVLPAAFGLLALLVLLPTLWTQPAENIYPVSGDSEKYDNAAEGWARFIHDLPSLAPKFFQGGLSEEEQAEYRFDEGLLQHAPAYVVSVGNLYAFGFPRPDSGRILTVVFVGLTVALLVFWSQRRFGTAAAIIFGLLFVFWPSHIWFGNAIMTEMATAFFLAVGLVALDETRERGFRGRAVGGALLAIALLVKFSLRWFFVPILLVDFLLAWKERDRMRLLGARFAGFLAVSAVWFGFLAMAGLPADPPAVRKDGPLWFFRGNYVPDLGFESVGLGDVTPEKIIPIIKKHGEAPESDRLRLIYTEALLTTIKSDPVSWLGLVAAKVRWFWTLPGCNDDVFTWFGRIPPPARFQVVVVFLMLIGMGTSLYRGGRGTLPALAALGLTGVHALSHMVTRYNVPAIALMLPYAGLGAVTLFHLARARLGGQLQRKEWIVLGLAALFWFLDVVLGRDMWVGLGQDWRTAANLQLTFAFLGLLGLAAFLFLRLRRSGVGFWPPLGAAAVVLLVAGSTWGDRYVDPERDRWACRLSKPGDKVIQQIDLPENLGWNAFRRAEILIDMAQDPGSTIGCVVRVNGEVARVYREELTNPEEDYTFDEHIHVVQKRWDRVRRDLEKRLVHQRRRNPDAGMKDYRQWFRVPIEIAWVEGREDVIIEIELTEASGGGLRIFGDSDVDLSNTTYRSIRMPAFLENPYDASTYKFTFFATDRERADVRFVTDHRLYSPAARGWFVRDGQDHGEDLSPARGSQKGEFRVRLRAQLLGRYVYREKEEGGRKPTWAVFPREGDRPMSASDVRLSASRREIFVDGWRTF